MPRGWSWRAEELESWGKTESGSERVREPEKDGAGELES
jgi:hypothetical protein